MANKSELAQLYKSQAKEHLSEMDRVLRRIDNLYYDLATKIGIIGATASVPKDAPFYIEEHPDIRKRVDNALTDMYGTLESAVVSGVRSQWTLANNHMDELTRVVFGSKIDSLSSADMQRYFNNHEKALEAFLKRKENGMDLSQRVWKYAETTKVEIESALELGMKTGESAQVMAKNLMQYLKKPDALYRRIRDKEGVLHLSGNAIQYHPGQGVYRSSYMNAKRLAATETNMAYDTADHLRVQDMDFVVGIKISLSNNHTCLNSKGLPEPFTDICDDLQGKYPKDFKFTGWHPFCYDDKTEVLTKRGWQRFVDVHDDDLILSLNPETKSVEWAGISNQFSWEHKGDMIRFYNRSLDMVVTPDHPVVYVSKSDGRIRKAQAKDYRMGLGAIYRSSKYCADDVESVTIGGRVVPFDAFAEFMGYWLADGSLLRDYQVVISQEDEDHRTDMLSCIGEMGFKAHENKGKISFYDKSFNSYLKQFGRAYDKYVPDLIKNSSPRQIKIFLDAFVSCDGCVREGKTFVGNRGSVAIPSKERVYFSSSPRMQADLGECLVKIGKRPSYRLNSKAGTVVRFRNGEYTTNYDSYTISECNSATASVFTKEVIPYDGMVYDVELSKNHIMYLRRSGKCYWGSNCRCISTTILKTEDELIRDMDGEDRGSVNEVKDVPEGFKKWLADNEKRAEYSYSMPYFIKDNLGTPYIPEKWAGLYGSKMPYDTFEEYDKARKYNAVFGHFSPEQKRNHKELSEKLPVSQGKVMPFGQADSEHPNPHYNDNGSDQKGYHHNCQTCTVAYELRRRGFNIEALPNPVVGTYKGEDDREVWKFFRDRHMSQDERFLAPKTGVGVSWNMSKGVLDTNAKRLRFIESETQEEGRYEIYLRWAHKGKRGGAHVIIAEKQRNGNLVFYDPQNGRHWAKGGDDFKEFHKRYLDIVSCMDGNAIGVLRIDNKLINPKFAERFIRSG